jgi:hypothetical protein
MRLRIIQRPFIKSIDGISLEYFEPGWTYDVGPLTAAYLLAERWAVPAETLPTFSFADSPGIFGRVVRPNLIHEIFPPYFDKLRAIAADAHRRRRKPRHK